MTHRLIVSTLGISIACASCASNPPAGDASQAGQSNPAAKQLAANDRKPAPAARGAAAAGAPIAPADARLTLYCMAVPGPGHVERAKQFKQQLVAQTNWNDVYLVHGDDQTVLYHGYYKDYTGGRNAREKQRAEADREKVTAFRDARGDRPFAGAMFVDLSTPDPTGPPEWNLANTPADRMWTLQIAAYKDSPLRKQYAVDAVREARRQGVEAYYYHGDTVSSVCIGAFPREALREQDSAAAETYQSDQPLVVLSAPLPAGASEELYVRDDRGKTVKAKAMAPRVEPVDPALLAAIRQYPRHSINGEEVANVSRNGRTGRTVRTYDPSFIVEIRHPGDAFAGVIQPDAAPPVAPSAAARPRQSKQGAGGAGQLRGLGD